MARTIVAACLLLALSSSATAALLSPEAGSESGVELSPESTLGLANPKQADPPVAVESGPTEQTAACALADQGQLKGQLDQFTAACPARGESGETDLDRVHLLETTPVDHEPNLDPNDLVGNDGGLTLDLDGLDLVGVVDDPSLLLDLRGLGLEFAAAAADPVSQTALSFEPFDVGSHILNLAGRRAAGAGEGEFGFGPASDATARPATGGGRAPSSMASAGAEPVGSGVLALALIVMAACVLLCAAVSAGFQAPAGSARRPAGAVERKM